jgi:hypothetical protein
MVFSPRNDGKWLVCGRTNGGRVINDDKQCELARRAEEVVRELRGWTLDYWNKQQTRIARRRA